MPGAPGPAPLRDQSVGGFDLSIGNAAPPRTSEGLTGRQSMQHPWRTAASAGIPTPPWLTRAPALARCICRRTRHATLAFDTPGRGLVEITAASRLGRAQRHRDGLLTLFIRHTSASLLIQENADPDVRADLDRFFARLVPDGDPLFATRRRPRRHAGARARGAHRRQLSIPVVAARARARHLAGHLPVGASPAAASARSRAAPAGDGGAVA